MIRSRFEKMIERDGPGKSHAVRTKSEVVNAQELIYPKEPSFAYVYEYWHTITLYNVFRANDAQLKNATETSKRILASHLYNDVLRELDRILSAAYANDFEEVVGTANALRNDLIKVFDGE